MSEFSVEVLMDPPRVHIGHRRGSTDDRWFVSCVPKTSTLKNDSNEVRLTSGTYGLSSEHSAKGVKLEHLEFDPAMSKCLREQHVIVNGMYDEIWILEDSTRFAEIVRGLVQRICAGQIKAFYKPPRNPTKLIWLKRGDSLTGKFETMRRLGCTDDFKNTEKTRKIQDARKLLLKSTSAAIIKSYAKFLTEDERELGGSNGKGDRDSDDEQASTPSTVKPKTTKTRKPKKSSRIVTRDSPPDSPEKSSSSDTGFRKRKIHTGPPKTPPSNPEAVPAEKPKEKSRSRDKSPEMSPNKKTKTSYTSELPDTEETLNKAIRKLRSRMTNGEVAYDEGVRRLDELREKRDKL